MPAYFRDSANTPFIYREVKVALLPNKQACNGLVYGFDHAIIKNILGMRFTPQAGSPMQLHPLVTNLCQQFGWDRCGSFAVIDRAL